MGLSSDFHSISYTEKVFDQRIFCRDVRSVSSPASANRLSLLRISQYTEAMSGSSDDAVRREVMGGLAKGLEVIRFLSAAGVHDSE